MSIIKSSGKHHRTYSVQNHVHAEWEFIYCTTGKGYVCFPTGEVIDYAKGDVVAIPPNVYHSNNSVSGFTNIFFTIENAAIPYKTPIKYSDDSTMHLLNAFNEAYYYFNSEIDKKDVVLSALSDLIVAYAILSYNQTPYSEYVVTLRNNIIKNFSDSTYKIEDELSKIPASYEYLRKLFKKEVGVTPLEFLTDTRMKLAQKLLKVMKSSEYNVSEIAEMCGFSDALYFSRVFKKYYGVSPMRYAFSRNAAEGVGQSKKEN